VGLEKTFIPLCLCFHACNYRHLQNHMASPFIFLRENTAGVLLSNVRVFHCAHDRRWQRTHPATQAHPLSSPV
jgi:hypothetical protein